MTDDRPTLYVLIAGLRALNYPDAADMVAAVVQERDKLARRVAELEEREQTYVRDIRSIRHRVEEIAMVAELLSRLGPLSNATYPTEGITHDRR